MKVDHLLFHGGCHSSQGGQCGCVTPGPSAHPCLNTHLCNPSSTWSCRGLTLRPFASLGVSDAHRPSHGAWDEMSLCLRNGSRKKPCSVQRMAGCGCFWPQFSYRFTKASVQKATRWCRCPSRATQHTGGLVPSGGSEDGALTRDSPRDGPQVQPQRQKPLSPRQLTLAQSSRGQQGFSGLDTPGRGGEGLAQVAMEENRNTAAGSHWLSPRSLCLRSLRLTHPFHDCCQMVPQRKSRIEVWPRKAHAEM